MLISRNAEAVLTDYYRPKFMRRFNRHMDDHTNIALLRLAKTSRCTREKETAAFYQEIMERATGLYEKKKALLDRQVLCIFKAEKDPFNSLAFRPRLFVPFMAHRRICVCV